MLESILKNIHWLGHAGFRIEHEKILYIDPYQIQGGSLADVILITHSHFDHCSPEDIARVQGSHTVIVTEKDAAKKLSGNVKVIRAGESLEVDGIGIEAVPSYNIGKDFHPIKNGWLGFIIQLDDVRIYHAGDTDLIPEMNDYKVDIALMPVSGTYVMTAAEAIKATLAIKPKIAIPMHYGAIVGEDDDALAFQGGLKNLVNVVILEKS